MKRYLQYFKVLFIIIGVVAVFAVIAAVISSSKATTVAARANTECDTEERVFDYGDKLTDEQEADLRLLIAQKEQETGCDIVLVTLNESLKEYAESYKDSIGEVEPYQYTMVYADNFYDEHKFGYNKPGGNGVVILDNWFREEDGSVYSWMSTSGSAKEKYTTDMIEELFDISLESVVSDPYGAYVLVINNFADTMTGKSSLYGLLNPGVAFILALICAVIFILVNLSGNKGKKTTDAATYVAGGKPNMNRSEDRFLHKVVTTRKIPKNTGGSGSGGHISAGGASHGGGGHSR